MLASFYVNTYGVSDSTQWAAVITQFWFMIEPPQKWKSVPSVEKSKLNPVFPILYWISLVELGEFNQARLNVTQIFSVSPIHRSLFGIMLINLLLFHGSSCERPCLSDILFMLFLCKARSNKLPQSSAFPTTIRLFLFFSSWKCDTLQSI